MLTIQLQAADAVAIASLIAAADNNKGITPVLEQIRLNIHGSGVITASATNRFMIATYTADADVSCSCNVCGTGSERPEMEIGITAAAAKFITANVKRGNKWNTPANVELIADVETRELSVRHGAAVYGDVWPAGKFPDIDELITEWTPATEVMPVKLRQTWLSALGKLTDGFNKVDFWLYELGAARFNSGKPGPVKATAGNFTALIQPNLIK
jgi:hypothetical protein